MLTIKVTKETLSILNPIEWEVLSLRFGFKDDKLYDIKEIGEKFGITEMGLEQIELRAFDKIVQAEKNKGR